MTSGLRSFSASSICFIKISICNAKGKSILRSNPHSPIATTCGNSAEALDPMSALKTYLSTREDLKKLESEMLMAAQELLSEIGLGMDELDLATNSNQTSQLVISFE